MEKDVQQRPEKANRRGNGFGERANPIQGNNSNTGEDARRGRERIYMHLPEGAETMGDNVRKTLKREAGGSPMGEGEKARVSANS